MKTYTFDPSHPMPQPSKADRKQLVARIEYLREHYGFGRPETEARLPSILKATLVNILYELETEVAQLSVDKTPAADAKRPFPFDRAEFIAYNVKQTKTWLKNAIERETGEGFGEAFLYTNLELTTKLADLQGWSDDTGVKSAAFDQLSGAEQINALIKADPEIIVNKPKLDAIKDADVIAQDKIEALLESMKTASASDKKKIRTKLRALGYRISDQKKGE
jgi:hypothetical protein